MTLVITSNQLFENQTTKRRTNDNTKTVIQIGIGFIGSLLFTTILISTIL